MWTLNKALALGNMSQINFTLPAAETVIFGFVTRETWVFTFELSLKFKKVYGIRKFAIIVSPQLKSGGCKVICRILDPGQL